MATGTKSNPLEDWRDLKHLCLLNLIYDFTPANLVSAAYFSFWQIASKDQYNETIGSFMFELVVTVE